MNGERPLSDAEWLLDLQRRHGLPPTGSLDLETLRALRRDAHWLDGPETDARIARLENSLASTG